MAVLAGSLETPTQAADGRVAQLPGSAPCPASMVAVAPFGRNSPPAPAGWQRMD